eukprot:2831125-Pyramimonas_sp.AAC.1
MKQGARQHPNAGTERRGRRRLGVRQRPRQRQRASVDGDEANLSVHGVRGHRHHHDDHEADDEEGPSED